MWKSPLLFRKIRYQEQLHEVCNALSVVSQWVKKQACSCYYQKILWRHFFWQKMFFGCKFSFKPRLNSGWSGWEVEGSHGLSGQGDVHEERFLLALANQVLASWNWRKVGKKKILLRFLFLVVGSGFLAHWKNLAFTQNQDDKLVSIIGGEAYMNIYILRAKCWLDVKQEWMGDPHKYW